MVIIASHSINGAFNSIAGSHGSSFAYFATHLLEVNGISGKCMAENAIISCMASKNYLYYHDLLLNHAYYANEIQLLIYLYIVYYHP